MISLVYSVNAEEPLTVSEFVEIRSTKSKAEIDVARRTTKNGDIHKVQGPDWYKHFDIPDTLEVVQVKKVKSRKDILWLLQPMRDKDGAVIQRRRFSVDIEEVLKHRKRRNGIRRVKNLEDIIIDKEKL